MFLMEGFDLIVPSASGIFFADLKFDSMIENARLLLYSAFLQVIILASEASYPYWQHCYLLATLLVVSYQSAMAALAS